eukprot:CAMPEP_0185918656 /NCGR_PEP_ID=MMETSP0924C-20121207/5987_1 /TAXON_ID=321610 /ORGANISM="Perkinsus chesapeaki, Strain ATCC PRA-65" /LENGTH=77 /DNA_ID=CAMNT_0028646593 /DNA_START=76 /DNA_END=305 /DNA_ORIENTATION=+
MDPLDGRRGMAAAAGLSILFDPEGIAPTAVGEKQTSGSITEEDSDSSKWISGDDFLGSDDEEGEGVELMSIGETYSG